MKAPFTKTVVNCFNIVRHIKRTATITCSRNMLLSNHNDRRIELAIGIYYFRSGVISLVMQLEAGLHAPMPKHFHHTLSSVISYQHLSVADSVSIGSYVSVCGINRSQRISWFYWVSAACSMLVSVSQKITLLLTLRFCEAIECQFYSLLILKHLTVPYKRHSLCV